MGASSSCCLCVAKAEESPCTGNGGVAKLERVGAEGPSTSGRSDYYSARCEAMMRSADQFSDDVALENELEIEFWSEVSRVEVAPQSVVKAEESPCTGNGGVAELERVRAEGPSTSGRSEYYCARCETMMRSADLFSDDVALENELEIEFWSEVSRVEVSPQLAKEEELNRENREVLEQLVAEYPDLFQHDLDSYVLGRKIAEGGQTKIYEVVGQPDRLMKVFERGISLRELGRCWPAAVLNEDVRQCIYYAGMLEDGRFAFLMERFWGDLRKLIDQAMQEKNVDGIQGPPFPYKWKPDYKTWTLYPVDLMLGIAVHMLSIHEKGISHRDLKASNILIHSKFDIVVADFECSIGVVGTGYWRAPEVLASLYTKNWYFTIEQWKKADVYSYGMICFEIVTGQIPFDGELRGNKNDYRLVIEGKRPQLPSDLDDGVKDLITKCWDTNPSLRPTFFEIVDVVKSMST